MFFIYTYTIEQTGRGKALDVASHLHHRSFLVREEVRVPVAEPVATRVDPLTATLEDNVDETVAGI